MTPQLYAGNPKPDTTLLKLMRQQRSLLIDSIQLMLAGGSATNAALIEAASLAVHQRAVTLIREWGTDRAWAIVAATEATLMTEEAPL